MDFVAPGAPSHNAPGVHLSHPPLSPVAHATGSATPASKICKSLDPAAAAALMAAQPSGGPHTTSWAPSSLAAQLSPPSWQCIWLPFSSAVNSPGTAQEHWSSRFRAPKATRT